MISDRDLEDVRKLADILLNWTRTELGPPNSYWKCIGDADELERVVSEKIRRVRESYLDDEAFDNRFTRLVHSLRKDSKSSQAMIEEALDGTIDQFVKDCCRQPGPEKLVDDSGRPIIEWVIAFDEGSITRR